MSQNSDIIRHKAALKIQLIFKINKCLNFLSEINKLDLINLAKTIEFTQFQKLIIKKEIINKTSDFINSMDRYKSGLNITPRIFLMSFIVHSYPKEILGDNNYDNQVEITAHNVINLLDSKLIPELWNAIKNFNIVFSKWIEMDKDRSIEDIIISYYYRNEHIKKIKEDNTVDFEQQYNMINELEKQKNILILSIKIIDKTFDTNFLKDNYVQIYTDIMTARNKMNINVSNIMKQAYYDIICDDIQKGEMMSSFNLLKDIRERLLVICPETNKELFKNKFNDNKLLELLTETEFTKDITSFIYFMVDFILLMDAPVNMESNNMWKNDVTNIIKTIPFYKGFPLILIMIEEHIDIIYDLILKLND